MLPAVNKNLFHAMNKSTKNFLRLLSVIVFGLGLAASQSWISIPIAAGNEDWLMVIGYGILLLISR